MGLLPGTGYGHNHSPLWPSSSSCQLLVIEEVVATAAAIRSVLFGLARRDPRASLALRLAHGAYSATKAQAKGTCTCHTTHIDILCLACSCQVPSRVVLECEGRDVDMYNISSVGKGRIMDYGAMGVGLQAVRA
eukprot:scaffold150792_cov35-Tisochrysis_lutea.AAC.4